MKQTCSKCGEPLEPNRVGKQRYCRSCHAGYMRATRPKHSDLSPEAKKKANCRAYSAMLIKRGDVPRGEHCENCGADNPERHHPDYDDPHNVEWLCRPCHLAYHKEAA